MDLSIVSAGLFMERNLWMTNRHVTNKEAADRLLADGLHADRDALLEVLAAVDHYRLSAYVYPFRDRTTGMFRDGVTLANIWGVYSFDRRLRLIAADALSRIEVAVRALIVRHYTAFNSDPFAYAEHANLPKITKAAHEVLLANIASAAHKGKYSLIYPELCVVMEIVPFGTLTYFYEGMPLSVQEKVANTFCVSPDVFGGWLTALRRARNVCAHNARFWNKRLDSKLTKRIGRAPELVGLDEVLKLQADGESPTAFTILSLCVYCLTIIRPQSRWQRRCKDLLMTATPFILRGMGFPPNWQTFMLWQ